MRQLKYILIVSVVLNVIFLSMTGFFTSRVLGSDWDRYPPTYEGRKTLLEVLPQSAPEDIVFLGDSLTQFCEWADLFQNPNIRNRGIAGDRTDGVLQRLDRVVESRPRKLFLMVGINDLGRQIQSQTILRNYREILTKITEDSPETELFVQSILPINSTINQEAYRLYSYRVTSGEIMEVNRQLRQLSEEFGATYIDLFPAFADADGQLFENFTFDGLHLNGQAYLAWKQAIESYID